jgi:hypothetical protein
MDDWYGRANKQTPRRTTRKPASMQVTIQKLLFDVPNQLVL